VAPLAASHPRFAGYSSAVAEAVLAGPYEIAIVTDDADDPMVAAAHRHAPPGSVIVVGACDAAGVPLLAGRPALEGRTTAYICRGFVCDRPVTTVADLVARLAV
jgi:uncharacterized protein YyaL (SSP411 family)